MHSQIGSRRVSILFVEIVAEIAQLVSADGDIIDGVTPPAVGSVRIIGADNKIIVSNIESNTLVNIYGLDGALEISLS